VQVEPERRIVHLVITGSLSRMDGLDYQRRMLAACDQLSRSRPWGILSDRRRATVQIPEVEAIMASVFARATAAGRTHAAVLATNALAQLQMKRLALAGGLVQKVFEDETPARAWLLRELK